MHWRKLFYEEIDSTNLQARRLLDSGQGGPGLVVAASHQTRGRGRRRADWWDLPGKSLLATLVLEGMTGVQATRLLSAAAAAAVSRAVGAYPLIKWPNDLVWGRRKLAGVLAESLPDGTVLAGIGINVDYLPGELPDPEAYASLSIMGPLKVGPAGLLDMLLEEVERRLPLGPEALADECQALLAFRGEEACLRPPLCVSGREDLAGKTLRGRVLGTDSEGLLLLETLDGVLRVASGDLYAPLKSGEEAAR
jgi:BirA family biotin operon repressor/biotin-[acetyl-CoA-carboxylase] ligase